MTVDVDLVIQADVDDGLRLARDLPSTPFMPLFDGVEEVVASAFILPIRHRVTGVRVDLAIGMSGFEREAVSRATPVAVVAAAIPVVYIEDLLVMKALAGRPQDEADIQGLVDVQRDAIDWERCLATARSLGDAIAVDIAGRLEAARWLRERRAALRSARLRPVRDGAVPHRAARWQGGLSLCRPVVLRTHARALRVACGR